MSSRSMRYRIFFLSTERAATEICTLSLHDALRIFVQPCERVQHRPPLVAPRQQARQQHRRPRGKMPAGEAEQRAAGADLQENPDRKSTRLNSSHANISSAVFCLKIKSLYSLARFHL